MWWMIGKVTDLTSFVPYVVFTLSDLFSYLCVAMTTKLEVANKALAEEKASRQVPNRDLPRNLILL
jgi:hypothetical protein